MFIYHSKFVRFYDLYNKIFDLKCFELCTGGNTFIVRTRDVA